MSHIHSIGINMLSLARKSSSLSFLSSRCLRIVSGYNERLCSTVNRSAKVTEQSVASDREPSEEGRDTAVEHTELEKELLVKVQTLSEEVESYKDKYQRALADRENLRQRLENQIRESKLYGIQSFCKDLLEVSDVFRKALESVPEEHTRTAETHFRNLYDGVIMTEHQLLAVFRRHGLEKVIPKEGDKFDPSLQEAMFEAPSDGKPPGSIAHVLRTGWKLHERCIRSAQVGVVKQ